MAAHFCVSSTKGSWRHGHVSVPSSSCECGGEDPNLPGPTFGSRDKFDGAAMGPVGPSMPLTPLGPAADGFFGRLRRDAAWFLGIETAMAKVKDRQQLSTSGGWGGGADQSSSYRSVGCETHTLPPPLVEVQSISAGATFDSGASAGAERDAHWGDSVAPMADEDDRDQLVAGGVAYLVDEGSSSGKRLVTRDGNGTVEAPHDARARRYSSSKVLAGAETDFGLAKEKEVDTIGALGHDGETTAMECADSEAEGGALRPISLLPRKEELRLQSVGVLERSYGVSSEQQRPQLRRGTPLSARLEGFADMERPEAEATTTGEEREAGLNLSLEGARGRTAVSRSLSSKRRRDGHCESAEGSMEVDGALKETRRRLVKCTLESRVKGLLVTSDQCVAYGGEKRCQVTDCGQAAEERSVFCNSHGGGKWCSVEDCGKAADGRSGVCATHGGGRRCAFKDCQKSARGRSDKCIRHGGGKRCTVPGCIRSAESCTGRCISHGGGRRCQFPECTKGAQGSTPFCKGHGGGKRCEIPGCTKGAEGRTPLCKAHGGGKRCLFQGGGHCGKSVHGGTMFCIGHGGGKRCGVEGCTKSARGRTSYCVRHGGGKRCLFSECTKSAQGRTDFCKAHGGGRRCEWLLEDGEACNKPVRSGRVNYCKVHAPLVTDEKVHGGALLHIFSRPATAAVATTTTTTTTPTPQATLETSLQPPESIGIRPGLFSGLVGGWPCDLLTPQEPALPPQQQPPPSTPPSLDGLIEEDNKSSLPGKVAGTTSSQLHPAPRPLSHLAALENSFSAMNSSSPACRGISSVQGLADSRAADHGRSASGSGGVPSWVGGQPFGSEASFLSLLEENIDMVMDGMSSDDSEDDEEEEFDSDEEGTETMGFGLSGKDDEGKGAAGVDGEVGAGPLIPPMLLVPPSMHQELVKERQVQEDARLRAEKVWEEQQERWQEKLDGSQQQRQASAHMRKGKERVSEGVTSSEGPGPRGMTWEESQRLSGSQSWNGGAASFPGGQEYYEPGRLERRVYRGGLMASSLPNGRAQHHLPSFGGPTGRSYHHTAPSLFMPRPRHWPTPMAAGGVGGDPAMSFERAVGVGIGIAMATGMIPRGSLSAEIEAGMQMGMNMGVGDGMDRLFHGPGSLNTGASSGSSQRGPTSEAADGRRDDQAAGEPK